MQGMWKAALAAVAIACAVPAVAQTVNFEFSRSTSDEQTFQQYRGTSPLQAVRIDFYSYGSVPFALGYPTVMYTIDNRLNIEGLASGAAIGNTYFGTNDCNMVCTAGGTSDTFHFVVPSSDLGFFTGNGTFTIDDFSRIVAPAGAGSRPTLTTVGTITFVTNVPEPASWAMMLVGFAVVGGAMRSRRRVTYPG